jgi:hypothetical protein
MAADFEYDEGADHWSRLRRRLREQISEAAGQILSGSCDISQYKSLCARHSCLQEVLLLTQEIRRGDDIREREIPRRSPLSVEE